MPRRDGQRWPWLVVGAATVAFVLAFPVRVQLAKAEFDRQARRWAEANAISSAQASTVRELATMAVPDDAATLAEANQAIQHEAADQIARIRQEILSERTPDPAVARMRTTMARALRPGGQPESATRRVDAQRQRFHREIVVLHGQPHFGAADRARARFSRYADEPTGATIVTVSRATAVVIDVDRSAAATEHIDEWVPFSGGPMAVVTRTGYVAALVGGAAYAVSPDLSRPPVRLGDAAFIEPGGRPDTLRLVVFNPDDATTRSTEVDGQGHTVGGPQPDPVDTHDCSPPGDCVPDGEVLDHSGQRTAVGRIAGGTAVVSIEQPGHAPVAVKTPDDLRPEDCRFSPNGSSLACIFEPADVVSVPFHLHLGVVDAATGEVHVVDGLAGSAPLRQIRWTDDGGRVFISSGNSHPLATFRIGDTRVVPLRYISTEVQDFVVLPARP